MEISEIKWVNKCDRYNIIYWGVVNYTILFKLYKESKLHYDYFKEKPYALVIYLPHEIVEFRGKLEYKMPEPRKFHYASQEECKDKAEDYLAKWLDNILGNEHT